MTAPAQFMILSPSARRRRRARASLVRGVVFFLGLAAALIAADGLAARHIRKTRGYNVVPVGSRSVIGPDVYDAVRLSKKKSTGVTALVVGDSVSRQLFLPHDEPDDSARFLTSNQAISLAGQFYLLRDALEGYPNARDVYLFYYPGSFENDLGPELAHDYFSAYFHAPGEMAEVFAVKRDFGLLASQAGRAVAPHLMLLNAASRPPPPVYGAAAATPPPAAGGYQQLPSDREPLLEAATALAGPPPRTRPQWDPTLPVGTRRLVVSSPVTRLFLPRLRDLCRARSVRLRVLPCPCSDREIFRDAEGVYDAPIFYLDRGQYIDGVHLEKPFIAPARNRMIDEYGLPAVLRRTRRSDGGAGKSE